MKTPTDSKLLKRAMANTVIVAIVLLASGIPRIDAVPSQEQHEMSGTVQHVDRETITILPDGEPRPVVFRWDKETKFFRNGAFATADALHPDVHVTIHCSHPIFGKPLLYRVAWEASSNKKGK
jgi:hypothetical protein